MHLFLLMAQYNEDHGNIVFVNLLEYNMMVAVVLINGGLTYKS